ncbi:MAG: OmpA family protein [Bacteroidetes bacterium]|nr:OmpA family protein [Bacteroidota bacterium]
MRNYFKLLFISLLLGQSFMADAQGPYQLQLTVFDQPVSTDYFVDMEDIRIAKDQNDLYRIYQGSYQSEEEAKAALSEAKEKGYQYATVIDVGAMNKYCAAACKPNLYVENIFFDFDSYALRAESRRDLSDLAVVLIENPGYRVLLTAHTDSKGSNDYNQRLSLNRAKSARDYLLAQGIKGDRVTVDYKGEANPIAQNETSSGIDSPGGRQYNRRVEVTLFGADGNLIPNVVQDIEVPSNLRF